MIAHLPHKLKVEIALDGEKDLKRVFERRTRNERKTTVDGKLEK